MKTQLSFLVAFLFVAFSSFAQTKPAATTSEKIKVWGNCGMCKTTIEKAAKSAGASTADWDEDTKILTVKYEATKTTNKKIQEKVAASGYDTQEFTASEKAYNNLHGCCQYDRKETEKKD